MRKLTAGIVGAAAVAASLVLFRQPKQVHRPEQQQEVIPAGEKVPGKISLERLRELGY